jgi:hypothetical protein
MSEKQRRRDLIRGASAVPAGVYRIVNRESGRMLIGATENLRGMQNRLEFAVSTGSVSALDGRLAADAREHGIDSFVFEVLDTLDRPEDSTSVRDDLDALVDLWRERLAGEPMY